MRLDLHIDRLVLEGFSPAEGRVVGRALERELARLVARDGLPAGLDARGSIPRIDAGTVGLGRTARPAAAGRQLARRVYNGLAGQGGKR